MITTETNKGQKCRKCGHGLNEASSLAGDYKPSAGDYSMCLACGNLSVFNDDLTLRESNPDEAEEMLKSALLMTAQLVRASEIGDRLNAH